MNGRDVSFDDIKSRADESLKAGKGEKRFSTPYSSSFPTDAIDTWKGEKNGLSSSGSNLGDLTIIFHHLGGITVSLNPF